MLVDALVTELNGIQVAWIVVKDDTSIPAIPLFDEVIYSSLPEIIPLDLPGLSRRGFIVERAFVPHLNGCPRLANQRTVEAGGQSHS